jgi:hypothetical protein
MRPEEAIRELIALCDQMIEDLEVAKLREQIAHEELMAILRGRS